MALVFLDVNTFGKSWFDPIFADLQNSKNVIFLYCEVDKNLHEIEKVIKAKNFFKIMGDKGRRLDVDKSRVEAQIKYLEGRSEWHEESTCDDPHVFAIVFVQPARFVFSEDRRMATCRRCMNRVIDRRFCNFIVIPSDNVYRRHRERVIA